MLAELDKNQNKHCFSWWFWLFHWHKGRSNGTSKIFGEYKILVYKDIHLGKNIFCLNLDYIFLLNCLQEFVLKPDILPALSTDHSLIINSAKGNSFWKFISSLTYDEICLKGLKKNILNGNSQLNWEFLKYEIWKFTINYSKNIIKNTKNMTERLQGDSNSQPFSS